jgi:hypothetical protein
MFGCRFITTVGKNFNEFMCGRLYKFSRFTRNDTVSGLITTASDNTLSNIFYQYIFTSIS